MLQSDANNLQVRMVEAEKDLRRCLRQQTESDQSPAGLGGGAGGELTPGRTAGLSRRDIRLSPGHRMRPVAADQPRGGGCSVVRRAAQLDLSRTLGAGGGVSACIASCAGGKVTVVASLHGLDVQALLLCGRTRSPLHLPNSPDRAEARGSRAVNSSMNCLSKRCQLNSSARRRAA
jgi:hypothetical protein